MPEATMSTDEQLKNAFAALNRFNVDLIEYKKNGDFAQIQATETRIALLWEQVAILEQRQIDERNELNPQNIISDPEPETVSEIQ